MLLKSLICKGIVKLELSSFLVSKAYAPLPLCLVKSVILKLLLKIASTKYLHPTSIPIPAMHSSASFIGETHAFSQENFNKIPFFSHINLPFPGYPEKFLPSDE